MKNKQSKYFLKRFTEQEEHVNQLTKTKMKELQKIYKDCSKELERELSHFIHRYSYANDLSRAELKRMLNTKEVANFRYSIKEYVEEIERLGEDTPEGMALKKELDILAGRTRIARIEELKTIIDNQINTTNLKLLFEAKEHLTQVVNTFYDDTVEIVRGNAIGSLDAELLEQIVGQKWNGKNYSDRIWANRSKLAKKVMSNVVSGLAQGKDYIAMSEQLQKDMASGYFEARRLIHTETTFALERAKGKAYKDMGIQKYKFVAVMDRDTSEICRELNGKIFEMKDRKQGVNCPPMHPFCRSVTVPIAEKRVKNLKESIEKLEKSGKIKESGATVFKKTNEFLKNEEYARREKHAKLFYKEVVNRDRGNIINKVWKNIKNLNSKYVKGFTKADVSIAFQHTFENKYELIGGYKNFDPDYHMAVSWQRLMDNMNITDMDLIMLRHERLEYDYMNRDGMNYREAHDKTEKIYNYSKLTDELDKKKGIIW